jgi:hypothetical protein
MPTSIAPKMVASSCWFVAAPQIETNGSKTKAGNGGNGMIPWPVLCPAAFRIGIVSW